MISVPKTAFLDVFGTRTTQEDPLLNFAFLIRIDGFKRMGFTKASGLTVSFDTVEYREGGNNATKQKRPGLATFPDITLERGIILAGKAGPQDVVNWTNQIFSIANKGLSMAPSFRRTIVIQVLDAEAEVIRQYTVSEAWPKEVQALGELDAMASQNLMEKMVIAHEGFRQDF